MIRIVAALWVAGALHAQTTASISGRIINEATKKPARAEWVVLAKTGQGLETVRQLENVSEYSFADVPLLSGSPYLVRAYYDGVVYTQNVLVQEGKPYVVNLSVYPSTDRWASLSVRIPHLIIVRNGPQLEVQQTFEIFNSGSTTYNLPSERQPTFRFDVPGGARVSQVMTSYNRSLPVMTASFDHQGAHAVNVPFRPGSTQIQLTYVADYSEAGFVFSSKFFHDIDECFVFVSPADVGVASDRLVQQQDAQLAANDFAVYKVDRLTANSVLSFTMTGGTTTQRESHGDHGQVVAFPSRIQSRIWVILPALLGVFLLVLFFALQKSNSGAGIPKNTRIKKAHAKGDGHDLIQTREKLVTRIAELDDRFVRKEIEPKDYEKTRSDLKSELMRVARSIEKHD